MICFCITCLNWWTRQGNLNGEIVRRHKYKEASKFQNHCLSWGHLPYLVAHSCMGKVENKAWSLCKGRYKRKKIPKPKASKWWHPGKWTEKEHSQKEIEAIKATVNENHQNNQTQNTVGFVKTHTDYEMIISHMFREARYEDYQEGQETFQKSLDICKARTK